MLPKVLGSKCDIAFMEDCLEKKPLDCSAAKGKKKKQCKCYKKCKKDDDTCKAACKEEPEPLERRGRGGRTPRPRSPSQSDRQSRSFLDCSFLMNKGKKRNKCCKKKCKKADDKETCIETCIAA